MADGDDKILVLGATSLVGRFLSPRLAAAETREIVALSRSLRTPMAGVRWVQGDLARPQTLATAGPVGEVYSLSPIWCLPGALPALAALGMRRIVAFSSTSVLTKAASTSAYEREVVRKLSEGETAVEAFCASHGIGFTILRPTLIYAEGQDANVSRLAALIRRLGVLPLPGGGRGLRQPVHADDLAVLARLAMRRPAANRAYAAPGGETLIYRAMVERIFEGLGRKPAILSIPEPLAALALACLGPFLPPTTAQMIGRVNDDLVFDGDEVRREFDWAPRDFRPKF